PTRRLDGRARTVTQMVAMLALTGLWLPPAAEAQGKKPNILIVWGDDIGISNISAYSSGLMGYRTPNIDRLAAEGMRFTDSYGEQGCTAGRSSFTTGQSVYSTGLSKVGVPGSRIGLPAEEPTIAEPLKPPGHATGQLRTDPPGQANKTLPTAHWIGRFFPTHP